MEIVIPFLQKNWLHSSSNGRTVNHELIKMWTETVVACLLPHNPIEKLRHLKTNFTFSQDKGCWDETGTKHLQNSD
jgi:hypothetical protein